MFWKQVDLQKAFDNQPRDPDHKAPEDELSDQGLDCSYDKQLWILLDILK